MVDPLVRGVAPVVGHGAGRALDLPADPSRVMETAIIYLTTATGVVDELRCGAKARISLPPQYNVQPSSTNRAMCRRGREGC